MLAVVSWRQPGQGSPLKSCLMEGRVGDPKGLSTVTGSWGACLPSSCPPQIPSHPGRCCSEQLAGSLLTGFAILGNRLPGPRLCTPNTQLSPCPGLLALSPQSCSSPWKLSHHVLTPGREGSRGWDSIRVSPCPHVVQRLLARLAWPKLGMT